MPESDEWISSQNNQTKMVPIPYKRPFIEMFEDIYMGIDEDFFSEEKILHLYGNVSRVIIQDTKSCESSECKKLRKISKMTRKFKRKLQRIFKSEKSGVKINKKIKNLLCKTTLRMIKMFQDVSNETTALVEKTSNIWRNEKKCYSNAQTRNGKYFRHSNLEIGNLGHDNEIKSCLT